MKTNLNKRFYPLVCALVALILTMSCNTGLLQAEQPDPSLTALYEAVKGTVTAAALVGDESSGDLATAQAKATATQQNVTAKQTESAVGRSEEDKGTATVAAPIMAELEVYGLDPERGQVGWIHEPLTIEITGYQQFTFANDYPGVTARDFVLASDITWDTQYGSNGCGFMFRSNGDQNKPSQYMVTLSRFSSGLALFLALKDGEMHNIHNFYPKTEDRSFEWENQTTNRLAIVGRGTLIEIYTNNVKIGEIDTALPPEQMSFPSAPIKPGDNADQATIDRYTNQVAEYQAIVDQFKSNYQVALSNNQKDPAIFEDGFLGMIAMSESGRTACTFTDTWLWQIED
jgi:hypothetical protein